MRTVDAIEGHVEKQRLASGLGLDEPTGFLRHELGGIALLRQSVVIAIPVWLPVADVSEIIDRPEHVAILMIESSMRRGVCRLKLSEMPFPTNRRRVSRLA